jgi:hypothetical protein
MWKGNEEVLEAFGETKASSQGPSSASKSQNLDAFAMSAAEVS